MKKLLLSVISLTLLLSTIAFIPNTLNPSHTPITAEAKSKYPTAWNSMPAANRTTTKTIKKGSVKSAVENALISGIAGALSIAATKKSIKKAEWNGLLASSMTFFTGSLMQNGKLTKSKKFITISKYSYRQIADPVMSPVTGNISNNYLEVRIVAKTYSGKKLIKKKTKYEKTSTLSKYQ